MVVLRPELAPGLHAGRPRDEARVGGAAVELVALPHLERRVEGHRPAVRVVVVGLGAAQLVEHRQVRLEVVGHAVEEQALVHRPDGSALAAGAVVGDHDDEGVLALAGLLEVVEQPADVVVGVGEEAGVDLGHPREEPLLFVGERVPRLRVVELREGLALRAPAGRRRADRVDRRQLGVGRDEAHLLLAGQRLLAQRLVAHVEAPLELVDPLPRRVVRRVAGARRVVEEERLLGRDRLGVPDELERLVGDVLGEVVALLRRLRLVDRVVVVDELGVPLVGLGAEEAVPALEAAAARPVAPRRRQVHLVASGRGATCRPCRCSSRARRGPRRACRSRAGSCRCRWGTRSRPR